MEPNNERKTPAGEQNELFKKQVFSDETLRTADPDEEETGEQHFETLTFDKPAVLDERLCRAQSRTAKPHSRRGKTGGSPSCRKAGKAPSARRTEKQIRFS